MAELAAGARFPAKLQRIVNEVSGDNISAQGRAYAIAQCNDLVANGIDGIHLYTLNKSDQTIKVLEGINLA